MTMKNHSLRPRASMPSGIGQDTRVRRTAATQDVERPGGDSNAFDCAVWRDLYAKIHHVPTARAILQMAEEIPDIVRLYPSLLVQARSTLIRHELHEERRVARWSRLQGLFASLFKRRQCVTPSAFSTRGRRMR
ncbi:hypothetical protein [Paraburkholderia tropica]|uniref:hypothetical protein n=1 Tax=Paraburkholderia tropica TaxID=92647 RepID=UPI002AB7C547|nr:hypothetical protein [Paraburkholderia tropica]